MRSKKFLWGLMLAIAITVVMLPATVFADEGDEGGGWYYEYDSEYALKGGKAVLEVRVLDSQTDQPFDGDIHYRWVDLDYYDPQDIGGDSSSYTATAIGHYGCYVTVNGETREDPVEFWVQSWTVGYSDSFYLKEGEEKLELPNFDLGDYDENDFSYQWKYSPYGEDTEEIALKGETKPYCTATKPGMYNCEVTRHDEYGEAIESELVTLYVFRLIEKVDITVNAPLCKQVSTTPTESFEYWEYLDVSKQTNRPVASTKTKGVEIFFSCWVCPYTTDVDPWDMNTSEKITFEAGQEYVLNLSISLEMGYCFVDEKDLKVTYNGFTPIHTDFDSGVVWAKVKAEHYKDAGTVTKAATTTAEGEKTFKCKGCGKVLGTESIPMLPKKSIPKKNTTVKKPTLTNVVANSSKKTNNPKWNKVSGATGYEIAWRLRGAKKWSTKNVGNTTQAVVAKQKMKGLYEYKVRAKKAETATTKAAVSSYSNVLYRYYYTMQKLKFKPEKKAIEVSWAKDSNATGYQILYSTSNKYKDGYGAKVITIGKNSITNKKVTGLQSGKTYYIQTRAIKKVGKTNYIGNLSSPIAVKVK